ncbi:MAG: Gfo/Idh/MocA family oxidoreductase [Spirochaetes bacterium]|nr:Gfo/Idh/MocA family oxidoreductase [Spirochaetota bacterium]
MVRLGIIGTGGMANDHARRFRKLRGVKLVACCDIREERAKAYAGTYDIPRWYTDYVTMLGDGGLDAVSVVTVDAAHAAVSLAAIEQGLAVLCEKPLATNLADARRMRDAAAKKGVVTQVNFSYRNASGAQAAAAWVASGGVGRVMHVEASYLQSWLSQDTWGDWRTKDALTWRLSTRHGSAGVLGDIGCHIYDLATLLAGDISALACEMKTFDKGIAGNRIGPYVLDANDSFVSTVELSGGGIGTVHATRWATGHHNSLRVRVYGDEGAVMVDLDRANDRYWVVRGRQAMRKADWKEVRCRPTPSQQERFVKAIRVGKSDACDFARGARVQTYLDGSLRSARMRRAVRVKA